MGIGDGGLVETGWLAAHLGDPDLRVYDCTVFLTPAGDGTVKIESGRAHFDKGHVPGAGFLDLISDLSDTRQSLRFMMPPAEKFAAAMGKAGLGDQCRVVLYCAGPPMWATRVWWMLRAFGFDNAAVLNGGWGRWKAEGREIATRAPAYPPATFTPKPRPGLFAGKDDVAAAISDGQTCVLNSLSRDMHSGKVASGVRPGRIAGSVNLPAMELLGEDLRLLDDSVLRERLGGVGAERGTRIITYCGGGIAATLTAFALARLGHDNVAVYDGSMSEWAVDPAAPMEVG
ncbi:MAG: sulfurtransferase [Sphingomonadales bacterium]